MNKKVKELLNSMGFEHTGGEYDFKEFPLFNVVPDEREYHTGYKVNYEHLDDSQEVHQFSSMIDYINGLNKGAEKVEVADDKPSPVDEVFTIERFDSSCTGKISYDIESNINGTVLSTPDADIAIMVFIELQSR